jgi:hypothetical protein
MTVDWEIRCALFETTLQIGSKREKNTTKQFDIEPEGKKQNKKNIVQHFLQVQVYFFFPCSLFILNLYSHSNEGAAVR